MPPPLDPRQLADAYGFELDALPPGARAAFDALIARAAQAEALADLDPLTGLLNRRAFLREVTRMGAFLDRYGGVSTVVFIDLDHFKAVNDAFGHAAGDAVLRGVARFILSRVRESDIVGRLGGDEFGVLLAHSGVTEAAAKANQLAELLRDTPIAHEGRVHRITASVGWHPLDRIEDAEAALARADEAMYAEKALRQEQRRRGAGIG